MINREKWIKEVAAKMADEHNQRYKQPVLLSGHHFENEATISVDLMLEKFGPLVLILEQLRDGRGITIFDIEQVLKELEKK